MHVLPLCLVAAIATLSEASGCLLTPPSTTPFTSTFNQPAPPLVKPEFEANFIQHKWYSMTLPRYHSLNEKTDVAPQGLE